MKKSLFLSVSADQKKMAKNIEQTWAEFPVDLLANIFSRLETTELLGSAQWVCKSWRHASEIPSAFQIIRISQNCDYSNRLSQSRLQELLAEAVRRSDGITELDITFPPLSDNDLLKVVADRKSRVRRLRLVCSTIIDRGLMELAPNLPLLEDLEIHDSVFVSKRAIEAIGSRSPLLRVFIFNEAVWMQEKDYNDASYAIASTMLGLRHLEMRRNRVTIEGVEAILKGCPNMQHPELSYCKNLDPDEESVCRWRNKVKNLVLCKAEKEDQVLCLSHSMNLLSHRLRVRLEELSELVKDIQQN